MIKQLVNKNQKDDNKMSFFLGRLESREKICYDNNIKKEYAYGFNDFINISNCYRNYF